MLFLVAVGAVDIYVHGWAGMLSVLKNGGQDPRYRDYRDQGDEVVRESILYQGALIGLFVLYPTSECVSGRMALSEK